MLLLHFNPGEGAAESGHRVASVLDIVDHDDHYESLRITT
jgi:hypothetical protein